MIATATVLFYAMSSVFEALRRRSSVKRPLIPTEWPPSPSPPSTAPSDVDDNDDESAHSPSPSSPSSSLVHARRLGWRCTRGPNCCRRRFYLSSSSSSSSSSTSDEDVDQAVADLERRLWRLRVDAWRNDVDDAGAAINAPSEDEGFGAEGPPTDPADDDPSDDDPSDGSENEIGEDPSTVRIDGWRLVSTDEHGSRWYRGVVHVGAERSLTVPVDAWWRVLSEDAPSDDEEEDEVHRPIFKRERDEWWD